MLVHSIPVLVSPTTDITLIMFYYLYSQLIIPNVLFAELAAATH